MDIGEFKAKNPDYKDVPDDVLAGKLYDKYYAGKMPRDKFMQQAKPGGFFSGLGEGALQTFGNIDAAAAAEVGAFGAGHDMPKVRDWGFKTHDDLVAGLAKRASKSKTGAGKVGEIGGELVSYVATLPFSVPANAINYALELSKQGVPKEEAVRQAMLQGGSEWAGMRVPMGFKGKLKTKALKGAGTMEGIQAAGDVAKTASAQNVPMDPKVRAGLQEQNDPRDPSKIISNIVAGVLSPVMGRVLDKYPQLRQFLKQKFGKKPVAPPEAAAAPVPAATPSPEVEAPPKPAVAPAEHAQKPPAVVANVLKALHGDPAPKVEAPPAPAAEIPKPVPKTKRATAEEKLAVAREAQRQFDEENAGSLDDVLPTPPVSVVKPKEVVSPAAPKINPDAELPAGLGVLREGEGPHKGKAYGQHPVNFAHDLDRAAFFIGHPEYDARWKSEMKSTKDIHDEYLKFVMDNTGMTEDEAKAYGERVRSAVVDEAKAKEDAGIKHKQALYNRVPIYLEDHLGGGPQTPPTATPVHPPVQAAPAKPADLPGIPPKTQAEIDEEIDRANRHQQHRTEKARLQRLEEDAKAQAKAEKKANAPRAADKVEKEFADRKVFYDTRIKRAEGIINDSAADPKAKAGAMRERDHYKKSAKANALQLSAARRAAVGRETPLEFKRSLRSLLGEVRKTGLHPSLRSELKLSARDAQQAHPYLFRKSGMTGDDLREWMLDNGWLNDAEHAAADGKPGGDIGLAIERLEQELADPGSVMHPEDMHRAHERQMREEEEDRLADEFGLKNYSPEDIRRLAAEKAEAERADAANRALAGLDAAQSEYVMSGSPRPADELEARGQDTLFGKAAKKIAAGAVVGGASGAASASDDRGEGAEAGAAIGAAMAIGGGYLGYHAFKELGGTSAAKTLAHDMFDNLWKGAKKEGAVKAMADYRDATAARMNLRIVQLEHWGQKHAPNKSLADWIENGPGADKSFYDTLKDAFDASAEGVTKLKWKQPVAGKGKRPFSPTIGGMTSVWDMTDKTTREWAEAFHTNTDPNLDFPMFQFDKGLDAIKAGLKEGLKLATDDPWKAWANFSHEAAGAMTQGQMMVDLFNGHLSDGSAVLAPMHGSKAPERYVDIGKNWGGSLKDLNGMAVHESVVPSMKLSINTYEPGKAVRTMQSMTYAVKRNNVYGSLFHVSSLVQAGINNAVASGDVSALNIKRGLDFIYGEKTYALPDGRDAMQALVEKGLKIGAPLEDALGREDMHKMIDFVGNVVDRAFGGVKVGTTLAKIPKGWDKAVNKATWEVTHAGLKAQTALTQIEAALRKNQKADLDKLLENAAEYTNDLYGNIDWRRVGEGANSPVGRWVASNLFSGQGRALMDVTLFAPDWLMSTSRAWIKAVKPEVDAKGRPKWTEQNLRYAKQLAAGAVVTMALTDAIQYAATGTSSLDNEPKGKDPSFLDRWMAKMEVNFADGTRMNVGKHYKDFITMLDDPAQESLYKLGVIPSESIAQVQNQKWATAGKSGVAKGHYSPPMTYSKSLLGYGGIDRAKHAAGRLLPFAAQSAAVGSPMSGSNVEKVLTGIGGLPIRGMRKQELAESRREEADKKRKETAP